jgi:hypothetical protein
VDRKPCSRQGDRSGGEDLQGDGDSQGSREGRGRSLLDGYDAGRSPVGPWDEVALKEELGGPEGHGHFEDDRVAQVDRTMRAPPSLNGRRGRGGPEAQEADEKQ